MTDTNAPIELDTTANGSEVVEAIEPAPAAEAPKEETKVSLDDALAKAFKQHTPGEDGKTSTEVPADVKAESTKPIDPVTGRELEPMKAPAGWTPVLREKWSSIDPTVQKFIADRERDIAQTITKTAEDRKVRQQFEAIVAPHDATFRKLNVPAASVVQDLVGQWAAMQNGTPQQRAQIIDGLIRHFQPDVPTLIHLSQGQGVTRPAPPPPNVDEAVKAALAQREEQELSQTVNQQIESFKTDPKNEFFDAVSVQMGKIIEAGLVPTDTLPEMFKAAYELACSRDPEVQQVLKSRDGRTTQARAVGSIKPSLNAGNVKSSAPARKMSLDDAVKAAFHKHTA